MKADIYFRQVDWNTTAAAVMRAASGLSAAYTVEDLEQEVRAGRSALLQCIERRADGEHLLGYLAMWIEPQGKGLEMVIHAGAALSDERKAFAKVSPWLDDLARRYNCASIRAHVDGSRRAWLLRANGYERAEIVMRKWV